MRLKTAASHVFVLAALSFSPFLFAQDIHRIPVRVVVVANFETGADAGDAPGEYQFWVEREHLDEKVPVRGAPDVVRRNQEGLYGLCLRHGVTDLAAFVLDPRFDLRKTYWLFTGISSRPTRRFCGQCRVGKMGDQRRRVARDRRSYHPLGVALRIVGDRRVEAESASG
jgi:purine nucleoside permease